MDMASCNNPFIGEYFECGVALLHPWSGGVFLARWNIFIGQERVFGLM